MGRIIALILLIILIVVLGYLGLKNPGVAQVIQFNHIKHKEQGLDCLDCHNYVKEYKFAGLPNIETCSECHTDKITESKEEEKLLEFIQDKTYIPWNKIYSTPDHVYYSHAEHVGLANIECRNCHGNVGEKETPPKKPLVELSMEFCMDCHRKKNASLDCLACHI